MAAWPTDVSCPTRRYSYCYSKQGRGSSTPFFLRPTKEGCMDMSRRLALVLAGALMAALMVAMTGVASAQDVGCKGDIVLDPGHGGTDPGAVNNTYGHHLTEKAENLKVALDLKDLLMEDHYDVCMTRTTNDETLSNNDRYTYANTTGARVLISIHMNG